MKKISLYILSLLAAVAFTACDEDYKDWADPQSNDKEPAATITFEANNASQKTFDLNTVATELISIATQSLNSAEGTTTKYEVQFSQDNTFNVKSSANLEAEGNTLNITKANLQSAVVELCGKKPEARELYIRINAYVTSTSAGQVSLARSNAFQITVTPGAPEIEAEYYFIGDVTEWDIENLEAYQFSHSGDDVYDDPIFTYVVYTVEACNFKIVPKSSKEAASWDGVLGNAVDQNPDTEGALIIENAQAMRILESGLYRITLDMMEYTYKIDRLGDNLPESAYYLIGDPTGWNGSDASTFLKFEHSGKAVTEDPYFTLMFESTGNDYWKVVPQSSVDALDAKEIENVWGAGSLLGTAIDGDTSLNGIISPSLSNAMKVDKPGWVKITLNMMEYSYTVENIGEMALQLYVPGGHQGWAPATAPIVYTRNYDMKYEGYIYMAAGNGFKIITDPTWDSGTHYGDGGDGTLSSSGGDITIAEDGYYKLDVNMVATPITYTMTKIQWGLRGDAVGSWDVSTPMTYDSTSGTWKITTTLPTGQIKFVANNSWDINFGGDLDNLSYGGDNIVINEAGEYDITLDLSNAKAYKATIVKK